MIEANRTRDPSAPAARRAVSALFTSNGFAFGVWSAHISVFKQNYRLSNATLTVPLFTLALGAILAMPAVGRAFHRFDSSSIAWKGQICYALALASLPWAQSFTALAIGTFCLGLCRGAVDVSNNTQAIITERAYGSAVLSSVQGFWSLGGLIGAAFSSLLLRQHETPRFNFAAAAVVMTVTALASKSSLLEEASSGVSAGWALLPRALWSLAGFAFLALFIEGAIGDWGSVYLRNTLHVSAATAATGYAVFSFSMMAGCFVGDAVTMKLGHLTLLRISGLLVAAGFGFALLGMNYAAAMVGLLIAGFGSSNMVAIIFGAAARRSPGGIGAGIAAASTVGYLGFLVGPPAVGSVSSLVGLRLALVLVVLAGVVIAAAAGKVFGNK